MIPYDDALRERMTRNLNEHSRRAHALDGLRHAAVAIVLVDSQPDDHIDPFEVSDNPLRGVPGDVSGLDGRMTGVAGGAAFLLCRRAARMNRHAGQWALPGGKIDGDETPIEAALRETHEELGLHLDASSVLGLLDDYTTRSGFVMTPVIIWAGHGAEIVPDPAEVAHAYRIGLHELCREDSPRFVNIPESDRPVVQLPFGGDLIHAPTGAVLLQLRWVAIEGRIDERVDHLEQPVFAWR
ncbi:MAG: CoA pyrophosphatase [Actinobacteria bacterium]|nr:CoA pyrophosphatase [Actinomycetota bacterium]NDD97276.1 CoA pyrophosphatase [Actinomycetota bacterium]